MPFGAGALVAGGLQPGDHSTDQILTIDLGSGPHGAVDHLPVALHDSAGAVVRGRPTVFGGGGATELSVVQQRDRSGRWRTVGNLPGARSDLSVLPARSGVLVVGGYDGANTPRAVLRTSNGTAFSVHGQLPEGIRYAGVAIEGDTGWIVGGERDGNELDEVLQVDLRSGDIRRVGTLPHPLGHEGVVAVGGRLLLVGGRTAPDQVSDRLWWWRPPARSWTPAGRLPYPVADAAVLAHGSYLYLMGGETPAFTDRVTRVGWR